jgi:hypothetical protein
MTQPIPRDAIYRRRVFDAEVIGGIGAAQAFFRKALTTVAPRVPRKIELRLNSMSARVEIRYQESGELTANFVSEYARLQVRCRRKQAVPLIAAQLDAIGGAVLYDMLGLAGADDRNDSCRMTQ